MSDWSLCFDFSAPPLFMLTEEQLREALKVAHAKGDHDRYAMVATELKMRERPRVQKLGG